MLLVLIFYWFLFDTKTWSFWRTSFIASTTFIKHDRGPNFRTTGFFFSEIEVLWTNFIDVCMTCIHGLVDFRNCLMILLKWTSSIFSYNDGIWQFLMLTTNYVHLKRKLIIDQTVLSKIGMFYNIAQIFREKRRTNFQ